MEIIGTSQEEKNRKTKKVMIGITVTIVILLIISIALFVAIYYLRGKQFKFSVDGKALVATEDLFVFEGENVYISIKDIAPIVGYKYYNGGYKQYSEDISKCYLESENEVCTFEEDDDTIYKTPVEELDYEYYNVNNPVKRINEKLYVTSEGLSYACNLKFYYEPEKNQVTIYTLPYYANYYMKNVKTSAIAENFKNQKALLYDLLVIQNMDNTNQTSYDKNIRYGITDLDGNEIVGTKYTSIEFIESTKEFIVKTEENKVGIITADGETKVRPQYDSLKQIHKDLNLYLATNNDKKGVIEKNGKTLIYLEYDEIGVDTTQFQNNDIKNSYVLFDNAIPVKQNGKWGMYDIKGKIILPLEYDGIGCVSSDRTLNNVLVVPEKKGIVVYKILETQDKRKTTYYGIFNSVGKKLVDVALDTIYSVTNNGKEEYTMMNSGKSYDVIDYINTWAE